MNKILTIIVPSFNISKYIDEVVPNYIDLYFFDKVDILFIDDGATDDTEIKLRKYADLYPDYFHFIHKENGGHGSVINYALNSGLVKTKYFKVIDGDDWIESKGLAELVDFLYCCDDDIVISGFNRCYPNSVIPCFPIDSKKYKEKTEIDIGKIKYFTFTIHSLTFKTSLFVLNNIILSEKVFYEDNELRAIPLIYAKTFSFLNVCVYNYRLGNLEQSVSIQSKYKHFNDSIVVRKKVFDIYSKSRAEGIDKNVLRAMEKVIYSGVVNFSSILEFPISRKEKRKLCLDLVKELKKNKLYFRYILYSKRNMFNVITNFIFVR